MGFNEEPAAIWSGNDPRHGDYLAPAATADMLAVEALRMVTDAMGLTVVSDAIHNEACLHDMACDHFSERWRAEMAVDDAQDTAKDGGLPWAIALIRNLLDKLQAGQ